MSVYLDTSCLLKLLTHDDGQAAAAKALGYRVDSPGWSLPLPT